MQKYNGASRCYNSNTKIVHIHEATKLDNNFHDAGTGIEMIGIEIKVDTSREMHSTIDLENKKTIILKEPSLLLLRSLRKMVFV